MRADVALAETITPVVTDRPRTRIVETTAGKIVLPFGLAVIAIGAMMVIWLHARPGWGGVNPVTGMLSDYGIGSLGWVFDSAMDLIGAGSAALVVVMWSRGLLRRGPELALMVSWCVCVIGVGTCTKDPTAGAQTVRGTLHLAFTATACVSLPFAALLLGWRYRDHLWHRRFAGKARLFGLASVPCFLPFLVSFVVLRVSHGSRFAIVPTGLVERLMVVLDIAILAVFALWTRTAARGRPVVGS